jgi:hypothetical protein
VFRLDEIMLSENADVVIEILTVNGEADTYDYKNDFGVLIEIINPDAVTQFENITLNLQCDQYAHETYWQITDDSGTVIASGGNTIVGADGGGARVAAPGDPGAYSNNELVVETE